jgi:DamX protein
MRSVAAEAERSFLGLTHNPFLEPQQGFFERGGRKTQLEQLRHLSQWSRRVLLVTGPEGVGKTSIFRELVRTLEPGVKAARISGSLVNTGREVLAAAAIGFGLAPPQNANVQTLRHLLAEHVEACGQAERPCLALIDDAHLLDHRSVDELVHLTQESPLHLVLFGEVKMVPLLERAASAYGVGWQEIRLTGYGDADARDYLEWRFQQARYRGRVPFTDSEVKDMVLLSGGLPGRLNQMANALLAGLETGEVRRGRSVFPRMHGAVAALFATVVALLYVIAGDDPLVSPGGAFSEGGSTANVETPDADRIALPPQPASEQMDADRIPAEGIREPAVPPHPIPAESEALAAADPDPALKAESASEARVAELPEPVSEAAEPETTLTAAVEAPVQATVQATVQVTEEAADVEPARATTEALPLAAGQTVQPSAGTALTNRTVEPVSVPAASAEPAGRVARDSRWLLAQDPDSFTLQLVTVSALERAEAFVLKQTTPQDFAIYQLDREGRTLHVVVYGLFPTREAAMAAVDRLPPGVGDIRPWVRPLSQVQSAATIASRE